MDEQFRVDGPLRVTVKLGHGGVAVVAAASGAAWVTVHARDPGHEPSVELAARAVVRLVGAHLLVELPASGRLLGRSEVAIALGLPRHSSLAVKGGAVDVRVRGGLDALAVKVGTGTVEADEVAATLDVRAGQADVAVGRAGVAGVDGATAGRGRRRAVGAAAAVRVGTGSVALGRSHGAVLVKGGTVQLTIAEAGPGQVGLDAGSGSASIGVAAGTTVQLDLMSGRGEVRCELPMESAGPAGGAGLRLRLRTGSGDLRVTAAATADR